jgi:hypothetical protein
LHQLFHPKTIQRIYFAPMASFGALRSMKEKHLRTHPVFLIFVLSIFSTAIGFWMAWRETGAFCYALDDSFIMMALSKNLAFHRVWGLTQHQFSSTASSPLFAVLLAGIDLLAGDHIWMPLLINLFALAGLYFLCDYFGRQWDFTYGQRLLLLLGLFVFMPVPVLLFGSMEHILHSLIALGSLWIVIEDKGNYRTWVFPLMGMLLASIRYEGVLEGGILILWLWKEKKWLSGFLFGLGMLVPVCWLGFYSMAQGWFFLPNSLVLKAYGMNVQETGSLAGFLISLLSKAASYPHCMVAILALWLIKDTKAGMSGSNPVWTGMVLLISIAHFFLARYGHVYRYEGYLMALAWVAFFRVVVFSLKGQISLRLKDVFLTNPTMTAFVFILCLSPVYRSVESFANGSKAIVNIYEQQVQTALFVRQYYDDAVVAAIDVGAIAYYSNCRLQDLWGLGTMDFARLKLQNRYGPDEVDSVCRKLSVEIALIYGYPIREHGWRKAESWAIQDNRVCARDTVDFFALHEDSFQKLRSNLGQFRSQLPERVLLIQAADPEK